MAGVLRISFSRLLQLRLLTFQQFASFCDVFLHVVVILLTNTSQYCSSGLAKDKLRIHARIVIIAINVALFTV